MLQAHDTRSRQAPGLVVVGAGPAGLVAALAAARNGVDDVLVLEARGGSRRRNNVLLLDESILLALCQLGVDVSDFTPATAFTFIDGDSGAQFRFELNGTPPEGAALDQGKTGSLFSMFPRRSPAADVLISQLEQALLATIAQQPGIRIATRATIEAIGECPAGRRIEYRTPDGKHGVETPLLVVADGARGGTLEQLGIGRRGNRRQEVAMVANFLQPGRGQVKFQRSQPLEEVLALCSEQGSTVTVRMPIDTRPEEHADAAACSRFMRERAARLGIGGEFLDPPAVVEISHDRAERCTLAQDVYILGDAARTATPRLGLGANWAIRDALRLAGLLPAIRSSSRWRRAWACWSYRIRTRLATQILLWQGGLLQRSDRRGVRPMPARQRFRQKSLLMRFMWRAGQGTIQQVPSPAHSPAQFSTQSSTQTSSQSSTRSAAA